MTTNDLGLAEGYYLSEHIEEEVLVRVRAAGVGPAKNEYYKHGEWLVVLAEHNVYLACALTSDMQHD